MPDTTSLLDAALGIGHGLCADALWWDGRCTFTTDDVDELSAVWRVVHKTCGGDLYTGTSGIALFLARLAAMTGDAVIARTARGAMRHALADAAAPEMSSALFVGRLGIAWAAAMTGQWLADDDLVAQARDLALSCAGSGGLSGWDLMAGFAGGIVGALALARLLGEPALTGWAVELGDALLDAARQEDSGWHWPTSKETIGLCGLSHGAAGIAWALAELAATTGQPRFALAAARAIAHEQHWFDPVVGNWPDLSPESLAPDGTRSFSMSWCHGAPGIALSRLRLWQLADVPSLRRQANAAVEATQAKLRQDLARGTGNFSLCHGLAGDAEALICAAPLLDPGLLDTAMQVAADGIDRYGASGRAWPAGIGGGATTSPTLMLGLAGTGYFLLRLQDQGGTPSVLLPGAFAAGPCPPEPVVAEAFAPRAAAAAG